MLQLDVERPYAFLDLKLLALVEFVFADAVDYVLCLHVPIDVYGCGATRHFYGVEIPYRMLVFTHKCMVFGVLPCLYVNIVADVVFLLFVVHDHFIQNVVHAGISEVYLPAVHLYVLPWIICTLRYH